MIKKILAALVICSAILLSCAPELVPDEPSVELPSEDPEEKPQEKPDEGPEEPVQHPVQYLSPVRRQRPGGISGKRVCGDPAPAAQQLQ